MKVLIVDDSALMRRYLSDMLGSVVGITVLTARDGVDALEQIERSDPDVVTLDINMPNMDGLTCLSHIMTSFPRPVVMVSSLTESSAMATFEALEMGAVDYIPKPGGTVSLNIKSIRNELLIKVRAAFRQRSKFKKGIKRIARKISPKISNPATLTNDLPGLVVIGVSTGGPSALEYILPKIPSDFPLPVIVCQHMPGSFTGVFAQRLNAKCQLEVIEVKRSMALQVGRVYVAQGDADCAISIRGQQPYLVSQPAGREFNWHPSVSRLLQSVIQFVPANRVVSVMLTGMGDDGAAEMKKLFDRGAITLAEAEKDCAVFGMPKALIELNGASRIVELANMFNAISASAEKIARRGVITQWG